MTPASPDPGGQPASASAGASASPTCWTANRVEVRTWLQRNAPSLAELYEGAVLLLESTPLPGRTRLIAHAVREIRNRLPDIIGGPVKKQRLDYTSRVDEIAKLPGAQALIADLGARTAQPTTTITIDRKLAKKIGSLLQDHTTTRAKPLNAARRLFEGLAPENTTLRDTLTPVLEHWITITKWFVDRAHDAGYPDSHYPEAELRHRFTTFERTLGAVIRPFFDTLEELDAILNAANG
jgi:hypothetical protein